MNGSGVEGPDLSRPKIFRSEIGDSEFHFNGSKNFVHVHAQNDFGPRFTFDPSDCDIPSVWQRGRPRTGQWTAQNEFHQIRCFYIWQNLEFLYIWEILSRRKRFISVISTGSEYLFYFGLTYLLNTKCISREMSLNIYPSNFLPI